MLFILTLIIFLFVFWGALLRAYRHEKEEFKKNKIDLTKKLESLQKKDSGLSKKINEFDKETSYLFTFYETTRLISPLFQREKIINTFIEKLRLMEEVNRADLSRLEGPSCHSFKIGAGKDELYIDTSSFGVLRLGPMFAKLLAVCFEKLKLYDKLQELSIHDYLTGIYNRRYFDQRLEEEFLRAKNLKHKLSFLMLDIDNFKKVNDTYGHLVGDAVLKKCAALISESIRQIDFVGRIGGEEFGMILVDTDKAGAIMVSERICSRISQEKIKVFDERLAVTASIGVSTYPSNTIYLDLLTEIADKALFRAKASGRDRVCWF